MSETSISQPVESQDRQRDHDDGGEGLALALRSLPPDLLALFMQGRRLVRQDQCLKARPIFERFEEAIALRGMEYGQTLIDPLLECVGTSIVLGNMEAARETLRVCYALASRLKRSDRIREGYNIQALHMRWHLASDDLAGALALCGDAIGFRVSPGPRQDKRIWYGIEATQVLRRLGLHDLVLKLLQALETQIDGDMDVTALEMRIAILVCRLHILGSQSGVTFRRHGPLGWEPCDPHRARGELEATLPALRETSRKCEAAGSLAYAGFGHSMAEVYEPAFAADHARLLDFLVERLRQFRADGHMPMVQEALIDLAGLQIDNQLYSHAAASLDQARALQPLGVGPLVVAEVWHWLNHLCLRHAGQSERALEAYMAYSRSVDARTEACRRFLAEHLSNFSRAAAVDEDTVVKNDRRTTRLALDSMSRSDEDESFEKTLADLCESAESPAELAACMGVSPRRLQQMFKAWGLPPPARHLRDLRAAAAAAGRPSPGKDSRTGPRYDRRAGTSP